MSGSSATDQNQTDVLPAIVNLGFFDCYAFGNGVESFKIKDSLVGQSFDLGQRVTSVSSQDFKKADNDSNYNSIIYLVGKIINLYLISHRWVGVQHRTSSLY